MAKLISMAKLYNWVFHYNDYDEHWYGIPRELYTEYWQNPTAKGILKSKYINALIEEIGKIDEDENNML